MVRLSHQPPVARAPDAADRKHFDLTPYGLRDARSATTHLPEDRDLRALRPHGAGVHRERTDLAATLAAEPRTCARPEGEAPMGCNHAC